jgi:hypothetical protein
MTASRAAIATAPTSAREGCERVGGRLRQAPRRVASVVVLGRPSGGALQACACAGCAMGAAPRRLRRWLRFRCPRSTSVTLPAARAAPPLQSLASTDIAGGRGALLLPPPGIRPPLLCPFVGAGLRACPLILPAVLARRPNALRAAAALHAPRSRPCPIRRDANAAAVPHKPAAHSLLRYLARRSLASRRATRCSMRSKPCRNSRSSASSSSRGSGCIRAPGGAAQTRAAQRLGRAVHGEAPPLGLSGERAAAVCDASARRCWAANHGPHSAWTSQTRVFRALKPPGRREGAVGAWQGTLCGVRIGERGRWCHSFVVTGRLT